MNKETENILIKFLLAFSHQADADAVLVCQQNNGLIVHIVMNKKCGFYEHSIKEFEGLEIEYYAHNKKQIKKAFKTEKKLNNKPITTNFAQGEIYLDAYHVLEKLKKIATKKT